MLVTLFLVYDNRCYHQRIDYIDVTDIFNVNDSVVIQFSNGDEITRDKSITEDIDIDDVIAKIVYQTKITRKYVSQKYYTVDFLGINFGDEI